MGIYIKGVELPKDDDYTILTVYSDGVVYLRQCKGRLCLEDSTNATDIPEPHGRLIDAEEIDEEMDRFIEYNTKIGVMLDGETCFYKLKELLADAPTVIEGSEE